MEGQFKDELVLLKRYSKRCLKVGVFIAIVFPPACYLWKLDTMKVLFFKIKDMRKWKIDLGKMSIE